MFLFSAKKLPQNVINLRSGIIRGNQFFFIALSSFGQKDKKMKRKMLMFCFMMIFCPTKEKMAKESGPNELEL